MADFVEPIPGEQNVSNFTGRSRGSIADTSGATKVKGLGTAVDATLKFKDANIRRDIRDDVTQLFDDSMFSFTERDPAAPVSRGFDPNDLPAGARETFDSLQQASVSFSQGNIPESHYRGVLHARVKELRSRYPGYRDVVDAAVQSITGERPANALRSAMLREMSDLERSRSSAVSKNLSFLQSNLEYLDPGDAEFLQMAAENPQLMNEMRMKIAYRQQAEQNIKIRTNQLNLEAKQNDVALEDAELVARRNMDDIVNSEISANNSRINELIRRYDNGEISREEVVLATQEALREIQGKMLLTLSSGEGNELFAGMLGDKKDTIISDALQPLVDWANLRFGTEDITASSAKMLDEFIAQRSNQAMLSVLREVPEAATLKAIVDAVGPQSSIFLDESTVVGVQQRMAQLISTSQMANGTDLLTSVENIQQSPDMSSSQKRDAAQQAVQMRLSVLSNPNADLVTKKTVFNQMYTASDLRMWNNFDQKSRMQVYEQLINPEMFKAAEELGPEYVARYRNFARTSMQQVAELDDLVNDINRQNSELRDISYGWNDDTAELTFTTSEEFQQDSESVTQDRLVSNPLRDIDIIVRRRGETVFAQQNVDKFNGFVRTFANGLGLDLNNEEDRNTVKLLMLDQMGRKAIDLDAPHATSWLERLWLNTTNRLTPEQEAQGFESFEQVVREYQMTNGDSFAGRMLGGVNVPRVNEQTDSSIDRMEDTITDSEGTNRPDIPNFNSYDTALSYMSPARMGLGQPISESTLGELVEVSRPSGQYGRETKRMLGYVATPMGRYQIVGTTLRKLMGQMGLSEDTVFTEEVQDRMFLELLKGRGLDKFRSGEIDAAAFVREIAKEWEGVQKSRQARQELLQILETFKDNPSEDVVKEQVGSVLELV